MNIKGLLATAAMTAGLAIGLAANAYAAPVSDDFWECVADHQDPDGIGACSSSTEATTPHRRVWTYCTAIPRFACIKSTLVGGAPTACS
jgi:hypothetical protein